MNGIRSYALDEDESLLLKRVSEETRHWCSTHRTLEKALTQVGKLAQIPCAKRSPNLVNNYIIDVLNALKDSPGFTEERFQEYKGELEGFVRELHDPDSEHEESTSDGEQKAIQAGGEDKTVKKKQKRLFILEEHQSLLVNKLTDSLDEKVTSAMKLKDFEKEMFDRWQRYKNMAESTYLNFSFLSGMKNAMKCEIERQKALQGKKIFPADGMLELSQLENEEQYVKRLMEVHVGSREHPKQCRPCHFQAGLCWKGLTCPFCHICAKPKRKSKHQRDVDKRRAERYEKVKENLGDECLRTLREIDDKRREMMAISEKLKRDIKVAYSAGDQDLQRAALLNVNQFRDQSDPWQPRTQWDEYYEQTQEEPAHRSLEFSEMTVSGGNYGSSSSWFDADAQFGKSLWSARYVQEQHST
eukprot:GEMP01039027.1.p1 GENE.GEMP01039027.1~~GEMP01039027.1.p1  ORF type:complete len:414 (+),score=88.58 GEMP01039027.1:205-1446(+)